MTVKKIHYEWREQPPGCYPLGYDRALCFDRGEMDYTGQISLTDDWRKVTCKRCLKMRNGIDE